jgi:hypothetical protein
LSASGIEGNGKRSLRIPKLSAIKGISELKEEEYSLMPHFPLHNILHTVNCLSGEESLMRISQFIVYSRISP